MMADGKNETHFTRPFDEEEDEEDKREELRGGFSNFMMYD